MASYTLDDFDFTVPPECVAQFPAERRDDARLMVIDRRSRTRIHTVFSRITDFFKPSDCIVINDSRVIPARIPCRRSTGGRIEILLLNSSDNRRWSAICDRTSRVRIGEVVRPIRDQGISLRILRKNKGEIIIEADRPLNDTVLELIGEVALPPYIRRGITSEDRTRYQTVYARDPGSVAAPTAGLHFTEDILTRIKDKGIAVASVTLHVSWGTFQPVRVTQIEQHRMHSERYHVSEDAAQAINEARKRGGRIIVVGTTTLRVLETTYKDGVIRPGHGETDIFIRPPRIIRSADALLTNFHTPRSTLVMLVAAFAGYDFLMESYREAIEMRYRFFSYGDAMLIT